MNYRLQKNSFLWLLICLNLFTNELFGQESKPNILIVVADDLGWNDVSFHGSEIHTPNIDGLAKECTVLNRFYTAPICSPTRVGIMTGKYPNRFGMRYGVVSPVVKNGLPLGEITLPEFLADQGYKNRGAFGKWHLGHSHVKYHPLNQGFTYFYGHYNGAIDYFTHKRDAELDWHENFKASFDKGYSTDLIGNQVVKYISEVGSEGPFFAYVAYNAPHSPMQAKTEDLLYYGYDSDRESEDYPVGGQRKGERETATYGMQGRGNTLRQTYSGMVSAMDVSFGKIVSRLKEMDIYENTIIWFLSDNGGTYVYGGNNEPLRGQKHELYEGGVRVVSILKGVGKGFEKSSISAVTAYIDIFPTLADLIGADDHHTMDGRSVEPLLEDIVVPDRNLFLGKGAVVNDRWKLVNGELFQIEKDMVEKNNVAEKFPEQYRLLQSVTDSFQIIERGKYIVQDKEWLPPKNWKMPNSGQ